MKHGLILLTGLFFLSSSAWSAGTFKVTTPNGGQKWTAGKSYTVKWSKGSAGATVKIQLLKSGKHYKWVSKKTKNDGKHTWKIPTTVVTGSAYKIKITSIKNKKIFDKSNKNFTITKTGGGGGGGGVLKVTSPKNGAVLKIGKRYTIKWNKGSGSRVKIQLVNHDDIYLYDEPKITNSTPNDGKFTWTVPTNCSTCGQDTTDPGMRYRIKISSTTNSSIKDESDGFFTIKYSGSVGGTSGSKGTGSVIPWDRDKCELMEGKTLWRWEGFGSCYYSNAAGCQKEYRFAVNKPKTEYYYQDWIYLLGLSGCNIKRSSKITYSTKNWLCPGDTVKVNGKKCVIDDIR